MNIFKNSILAVIAATPLAAGAETVIFQEDFNGDYTSTFQYFHDADRLTPNNAIASLFYSSASGSYQPWWVLRDSSKSTDKFMGSHSYYSSPGRSSDWLISVPITIPTEGFVLTVDAQSVPVRGLDKLSDLSLYITESLIDPDNMPAEPTHVWPSVPYGADPDICENDWISLSYQLDQYAGKTVYINLVNENYDNDILCVDNVKISRYDAVDFAIDDYDQYIAESQARVSASLAAVGDEVISDWAVTLIADGNEVDRWIGPSLSAADGTVTLSGSFPVELGKTVDFKFVFTAGNAIVERQGSVTRMYLKPTHRVFFEESTSLMCGNCPTGTFAIETLQDDETYGDKIIPVSVHISAMGYDPMVNDAYDKAFAVTSAPLVFVERNTSYDGFNPSYDCVYNPSDDRSWASRMIKHIDRMAFIDVAVDGSWVISGNDTTAIQCRATVRPALDHKAKDYRIAFILTENNVGMDNNPFWMQENNLSGTKIEGGAGGWCALDRNVMNLRYHNVARFISAFNGHERSLPADLTMGEEYTYDYTLLIPETTYAIDGYEIARPIQRQFCELTAIVIDNTTGLVVNAARQPLSDVATDRFTAADLAGVENVAADSADPAAPVEYYNLQGQRIASPTPGQVVIRRQGPRATKLIHR